MVNRTQIRQIQESDSSRIAELNQELGYDTTSSLVKRQVKKLQSDNSHYGYVAVYDNKVVGYIHGCISIRLTTDPFAEITGLIVDSTYRKKGIGRKLVNHLEQEMNEVEKLRVRCNRKRKPAHEFYLALNYQEHKEQKVFELKLR